MAVDVSWSGVGLPIRWPGDGGWGYTLVEPVTARLVGECPDFVCKWGGISDGVLAVVGGYSWDGSTAVSEGGLDDVSGLPRTCVASLVHDWGYQFGRMMAGAWGWSHRAVLRFFDDEFYWLMVRWGVPRWRCAVRWAGVRCLGYPFTMAARFTRRLRGVVDECDRCPPCCMKRR